MAIPKSHDNDNIRLNGGWRKNSGSWDSSLGLVYWRVHGLLEQGAWLEVGLAASWHVDRLSSAGIPGTGLGSGVLSRECSESSNFDPVSFYQLLAHHGEQSIRGLFRDVFLCPGALGDRAGEMLLGNRQDGFPCRVGMGLKSSIPCSLALAENISRTFSCSRASRSSLLCSLRRLISSV